MSGAYIHGVTAEQIAALRELAETLSYKVSRGPGFGQGSLAGLLRDLADHYRADPYEVTFQVAKAVHRAYVMPAKYQQRKDTDQDTNSGQRGTKEGLGKA